MGESAIGARYHIFLAHNVGVIHDAVSHQLRVFDVIGGVGDNARYQHLIVGQLNVPPELPFVLVAWVGGFYGVSSGIHPENQVHHILQGNVGGMRAVPTAPTDVVPNPVLGQTF